MADEASPGANYLVALGEAVVALDGAIETALEAGGDITKPTDERANAFARAADLGKQRQRLLTADELFQQNLLLPNAPGPGVIQRAIDIAKALAQEVASDILATGKLVAVVGIVSAFSELVNTSKPVAAGAGPQAAPPIPDKATMTTLELERTTARWLEVMRSRQ